MNGLAIYMNYMNKIFRPVQTLDPARLATLEWNESNSNTSPVGRDWNGGMMAALIERLKKLILLCFSIIS